MPDLKAAAVYEWLTELRPDHAGADWPPAIRPVETTGGIAARLGDLGKLLDQAAASDLQALSQALRANPLRDDLTTVLAQLGVARTLRLLHWLSEVDLPECHSVIGGLLQSDRHAAGCLRAGVEAVTRQAAVRRMFAPERVTALQAACESMKGSG